MRRLLTQSAGAISGYVTGNLAVSLICGITTFIVLLVLGMPYAAPLALLVAFWISYRWLARLSVGLCSCRWAVRRALEGRGVARLILVYQQVEATYCNRWSTAKPSSSTGWQSSSRCW